MYHILYDYDDAKDIIRVLCYYLYKTVVIYIKSNYSSEKVIIYIKK